MPLQLGIHRTAPFVYSCVYDSPKFFQVYNFLRLIDARVNERCNSSKSAFCCIALFASVANCNDHTAEFWGKLSSVLLLMRLSLVEILESQLSASLAIWKDHKADFLRNLIKDCFAHAFPWPMTHSCDSFIWLVDVSLCTRPVHMTLLQAGEDA